MSKGYIYGFADGPENPHSIITKLTVDNPEARIDVNSKTIESKKILYIPPLSEQAKKIIQYLREHSDVDEIVCHSLGGLALVKAFEFAPELAKRLKKVTFLAMPFNSEVFTDSCNNLTDKSKVETQPKDIAPISYDLSQDFLEELSNLKSPSRYFITQIVKFPKYMQVTILEADKDRLKANETELIMLKEAIKALQSSINPLSVSYECINGANHHFTGHEEDIQRIISETNVETRIEQKEELFVKEFQQNNIEVAYP